MISFSAMTCAHALRAHGDPPPRPPPPPPPSPPSPPPSPPPPPPPPPATSRNDDRIVSVVAGSDSTCEPTTRATSATAAYVSWSRARWSRRPGRRGSVGSAPLEAADAPPRAARAEDSGSFYTSDDVGVELKGVRSGVERRRGVSGLKARDPGRRETNAGKKVLKERRSPRERGRMGTSVNRTRLKRAADFVVIRRDGREVRGSTAKHRVNALRRHVRSVVLRRERSGDAVGAERDRGDGRRAFRARGVRRRCIFDPTRRRPRAATPPPRASEPPSALRDPSDDVAQRVVIDLPARSQQRSDAIPRADGRPRRAPGHVASRSGPRHLGSVARHLYERTSGWSSKASEAELKGAEGGD